MAKAVKWGKFGLCPIETVKNINPAATQLYVDKADHFLQGMKLLSDDVTSYRSSVGLLAIHSAISLSDAITVGLTGKRGKYQDHSQAARGLERVCSKNKVDRRGLDHFRWLLARKNAVAYEEIRFDDASVKIAVDKAQRFNVWAYEQFREVLRAQADA